jgi:hypothetical protein
MYRLIKYEGKSGENKLDSIAAIHSLDGYFHWSPMVGGSIVFVYNDASGKLLHSSYIEEIIEVNNQIQIITRNSIFVFEEIKDGE